MLKNLKQFSLPEIEEKVLEFWKTNQIFKKSLEQRKNKKKFVFFEGPPTANGRPGIHHVLARVFKDIILRYKTMAGYFVPRRAGWDTHGLPVEIEIEKELGIKHKSEIEKFGIAEFNAKAKASVWRYKTDWEKLTERIGFWLDLENPYITYENKYIESLWWIFSQIDKRKLLKKFYKIVPFCPRCQTPLSSHEMGQPDVYRNVKDPSVYVKFALRQAQGKRAKTDEFLLVWTTTPWTLTANVAIAVNPALTYTKYKISQSGKPDEYLWSYNPPPVVDGIKISFVEKMAGKRLVGLKYEPLYKIQDSRFKIQDAYCVLAANFVSTEEGTGLVHIAPAYGEDDFNLISDSQFPISEIPVTINSQAIVNQGFPGEGKFIKEADKNIIEDLKNRNLLYYSDIIEHEYPFCWRCSSPLIYLARFSWFIEMSKLRKDLLKANKKINWIPSHLKEGRFGEWIKEAKDWAISRERYWGTPLPIWECLKCRNYLVIGGLDDLNKHAYSNNKFFLLRHGEADHNVGNWIASGPEKGKNISRLTKKGIEQAKKIAEKLKKEKIDVIYASPYIRIKEMAKIISEATGVKPIFDNRIVELNTGIFNGRPIPEHKKFFNEPLEEFTKTPPGGENLNDVKKRMLNFVKEIDRLHQNKNILIIGHGDPLWVLEGAMKNLPNEKILSLSYPELGNYRKITLNNWPTNENGELDLHRPFIDKIYLKCPKCKNPMNRVEETIDVWFDSGAMPFAQWHYPFENKDFIDKKIDFPADYISEGIDQTRGWFYTLLAVSTLLKKSTPFLNVISLGLILDKYGQKMSKSKGNVVDPWDIVNKYGVDTLRWYFYTINPPGEPKCFDENDLGKILRKLIFIIYNSFTFFDLYADKKILNTKYKMQNTNVLDQWIVARLNQTISETTKNLEKYEIGEAGRIIENFSDDLSRWYIRRSRRRFQRPSSTKDWQVASLTLYQVLLELSKLLAPFMPFFSEALYQSLKAKNDKRSVHLTDWPVVRKSQNLNLLKAMTEIRRITSLALAQREKAGIKVRQPLASLRIKNKELRIMNKELLNILKDEINVKEIIFDPKIKEEIELDTIITPQLKEEGVIREFTRLIQGLRHDAKYQPTDKIRLLIEVSEEFEKILEKNQNQLKKEVNAKIIEFKKSAKFEAELNTKIENQEIWIGISKV